MDVFGVGLPELLLILVLTLLVVGPQRLPEMAAQLGKLVREFRRQTSSISRDFTDAMQDMEREYNEMQGEWKEIGSGLEESAKDIEKELSGAERDARQAVDGTDGKKPGIGLPTADSEPAKPPDEP